MENDQLLNEAHEDLVRQRERVISKVKAMKDLHSDLRKIFDLKSLGNAFKTSEEWFDEIIKYIKEQPYNV